jgi:S1-C subfamily serine protease
LPLTAIDKTVASLQTHGKVRRGFLGIGAQAVRIPAAIASNHGLKQDRGLLVVNVEPDGPAERDGLLLGDVLISIEGAAVAEVEELQGRLTGDLVGRPVAIRLIRGGEPRELSVTVGERK